MLREIIFTAFLLFAIVNGQMKVGGHRKIDLNSNEVQHASKFAVTKLSEMSNSMYHKKLIIVTSAETQVVAGTNYFITFDIGTTGCKKNEIHRDNIDNCVVTEKVETCEVKVWDRPWLKKCELTKFSCAPKTHDNVQEITNNEI